MKARKVLSAFLASLMSLFVASTSMSCSYYNQNNNITHQQETLINDVNAIKYYSVYLSAFQNNQIDFGHIKFIDDNEIIWNKNEIIYENDEYVFFVNKYSSNCIYLEFLYKPVSRYYLVEFNFANEEIVNVKNKKILEKLIVSNVINNFKTEMISTYSLSNDEVYIPFSVDEKTIDIVNDAYTSFRTSWGVRDSSTRRSKFVFHLSNDTIRKTILTKEHINEDRVQITNVHMNDLYYLPLIEIIKTPIWHSWYYQNIIKFNNVELENEIKNKSYPLLLPKGSDSGQEWWYGLNSALGLVGFITSVSLMFSSGSSIAWISNLGYKALLSLANGSKGLSIVLGFLKENKEQNLIVDVDNTIDNIKKMGVKTSINQNINLNKTSDIEIEGQVKYDAKATSIFGTQSKAKIHDLIGFATADITWNEYKQINFNGEIERGINER